jgi:hypothetical protein
MAVNMIQNISKHRADRRITRNDLKRIAYAAYMNYYGTNAFYCGSDSRYPLGHIPDLTIVYIQGIEGNKVKILWSCETWTGAGTSPDTFSCSVYSSKTAWDDLLGIPEYNTEIPREQVKQEFTIEKDEYKILLIASCYTNSSAYKFKDGQKVSDDTKRLFGFYLLSFKINKEIVYNYMFQGRIVFTTDPGLFSDTPPQ